MIFNFLKVFYKFCQISNIFLKNNFKVKIDFLKTLFKLTKK